MSPKTGYSDQAKLFVVMQALQNVLFPDPGKGGSNYLPQPERVRKIFSNDDILKYCVPGTEVLITRNNIDDMVLFYLKNAIYSALVPDIKFYKVVTDKAKNTKTLIYCPFPKSMAEDYRQQNRAGVAVLAQRNLASANAASIGFPLRDRQVFSDVDLSRPIVQKKGQIGIKSFDWNYLGTDNYTAQRDIEAELTITMDSMGALAAERYNNNGEKYRLLDLAIQADCIVRNNIRASNPQTALKYNAGCYEIYVEAGFFIDKEKLNSIIKNMDLGNRPEDRVALNFTDAKIQKAIFAFENNDLEKLRNSMFLTVVDHTFSFGDNGKIDCTINYRARQSITEQREKESNILIDEQSFDLAVYYTDTIDLLTECIKVLESGNPLSTDLQKDLKANADRDVRDFGATNSPEVQKVKDKRQEFIDLKKSLIEYQTDNFFSDIVRILAREGRVPASGTTVSGARGSVGGAPKSKIYRYDDETTFLPDEFKFDIQASLNRATTLSSSPTAPPASSAGLQIIGDFWNNYEQTLLVQDLVKYLQKVKDKGTIRTYNPGGATRIPDGIGAAGFAGVATAATIESNQIAGIPFIFFGDLIDAVLTRARGPVSGVNRRRYANTRFVLSNMKVNAPFSFLKSTTSGNQIFFPMAALPLSLEMVRAVIEKRIKTPKKQSLTLTRFMEIIFSDIIEVIFAEEAVRIPMLQKKPKFKSQLFSHVEDPNNPDPTKPPSANTSISALNMSPRDVVVQSRPNVVLENFLTKLNKAVATSGSGSASGNLDIVCITEESSYDFQKKFGDIQEDFIRRIPHFTHGQGYGLIKKISLEKTDLPYQKEARFTQAKEEGDPDPDLFLTNFYNATFEMIGNDLCSLGGYIYFDPFGLAPDGSLGDPADSTTPSLAYIMGLGGIFVITKISHKMSPGTYTTSVKTRWEARGAVRDGTGGSSGP
jgi:hypothetical protein